MFWCQCFIISKDGKKLSAHRTLQIPSKEQGAQTLRRKKKKQQIKLLPQGGMSKREFYYFHVLF